MSYRKIWEKVYGKIPIDKYNRTYEIHHKDGNKKNNSINNLLCISIEEHYKIHLDKGEIHSANLIANRMKKPLLIGHHCSNEIKIKISNSKKGVSQSKAHSKKISDSNKGKKFTEEHKNNLRKKKINHLLACSKCGIIGASNSIKRFHFENCGNPYIMKREKCPHCGIESTKNVLTRWHFDKCKFKKNNL